MFSSQWLKNSSWGCIICASASLLVLLLLRKCLGLGMRNKVVFFRDRFWICRHIFWGKVSPGWIPTEGKEFSLKIFKWKYIWIRNNICFTFFLSSFKKHKLIFEKKSKRLWWFPHDSSYFFMKMPPFPSEIFGSSRRRKNDRDMTKQGCMAHSVQETRSNDCCVLFWPSNPFVSFKVPLFPLMLPNNAWFQNYPVLEMVCVWWCLALGLFITCKNSSQPYSSSRQVVHGHVFLFPWSPQGTRVTQATTRIHVLLKPIDRVSIDFSGSRWKFCVPTFSFLVQYPELQSCSFCPTCAWLSAVLSASPFAGGLHCDELDVKSFLPLVTEFRQLRKPHHACCCSLPQWTCSLEKVQIDWESHCP